MNVFAYFVSTIIDLNNSIDINVVIVEKCKRYFVFRIDTKLNIAFVEIAKKNSLKFSYFTRSLLKKKYTNRMKLKFENEN